MHRSIIALGALFVLGAGPALADDLSDAKQAISDAGISDQADLLMWCGAAYTIAAQVATDDATKKSTDDLATAAFTKAAPILTADGVADADFSKFGGYYGLLVKSQIVDQTEAAEHTQEECADALK